MLGVTPARVHALARSGQLAFRMAGRTRLIDPASVHRRKGQLRRAGRPMTSTAAWAALLTDLGAEKWDETCRRLGLSAKQRYNLKGLIARTPAENWAALTKGRATVHRYRVRPAYIDEVLRWSGVVRSGVSATATHGLDLVAADEAEIYTDAETHRVLQAEFQLRARESGNMVLRVPAVPAACAQVVLDREVMPMAVVAIDLMDSEDPRSRRTANEIIEHLAGVHPLDRPRSATTM